MDLNCLENDIAYGFKNRSFLEEACRHSSFVNEHPEMDLRDNERMEFLGDAVLNLVIGHILMDRFPYLPEGDLSRMRANLVNEFQLATLARQFQLGAYIQLGKGEMQSNGHEKRSILADAFEAVIAAVYLDGGFTAAFKFIETHFSQIIAEQDISMPHFDYKSRLQEVTQLQFKKIPVYSVLEETGPDHDKTFIVGINVQDIDTIGTGKSKKMAEQDAARRALKILESGKTTATDRCPEKAMENDSSYPDKCG